MDFCNDHGKVLESVGKIVAASEEHTRQLEKLFIKLDEVKKSVDQNAVRAEMWDKKIDEINRKIENGLRESLEETKKRVELLFNCVERRKQEREEEMKRGLVAYFRRGWLVFKERSAYIFIVTFIVGGFWVIVFIFAKIRIFHEAPTYLLHLFGVG